MKRSVRSCAGEKMMSRISWYCPVLRALGAELLDGDGLLIGVVALGQFGFGFTSMMRFTRFAAGPRAREGRKKERQC